MARPKNNVNWKTIIRRIKAEKLAPILSYQLTNSDFAARVVEAWAEEIGYPLADRNNLTRVAQFYSVTRRDSLAAKEEYLEFLKLRLLAQAREDQPDQEAFYDIIEDEIYDISFTEVAKRLGYPKFGDELENPLRVLAELPIPVYLTTNYATFLEDALREAGKEPHTEICFWNDDLYGEIPSVFEDDPDYQPTVESPVVYHFHGVDTSPSSIVLTEDDYLNFLVKVSRDPEAIPRRIAQSLADSSLLLLGYRLHGWDFRVVFSGLITSRRSSRRLLSLSIQFSVEEEGIEDVRDVEDYLKEYFGQINFDIYWGEVQNFTQELWENWEA